MKALALVLVVVGVMVTASCGGDDELWREQCRNASYKAQLCGVGCSTGTSSFKYYCDCDSPHQPGTWDETNGVQAQACIIAAPCSEMISVFADAAWGMDKNAQLFKCLSGYWW